MCEHARPDHVQILFRMTLREVLVLGSSERQPPLALDFLTTKNHARTGAVPLDGSNLDVVNARYHSRSL